MARMQTELLPPTTTGELSFCVYGTAKPGGSKRAFQHPKTKRILIVEDSDNRSWRQDVARAALEELGDRPMYDGPLAVEMTFFRPRPRSHYGAGRNTGQVKGSAPAFPATRPDVLKLARACEDALSGVLYRDDAQIVDERLRKCWGYPERVEITVTPL